MAGASTDVIHSSLTYQIILHLGGWYFAAFILAELLIFLFKGNVLPYPPIYITSEIILILLLAGVEWIRIFLGKKGNLTETTTPVILSLILSVPSFMCVLYLTIWQTYVLRIEVILNGILLVLYGLQFIFGMVCIITFARMPAYN